MDNSNYYTMTFEVGGKEINVGFNMDGLNVTLIDAGEVMVEREDSTMVSWLSSPAKESLFAKYGDKMKAVIQKEAYLRGF